MAAFEDGCEPDISRVVSSEVGTEYSGEGKQMIWKLARGWIEKCEQQHTIVSACLSSSDVPYCPKRLIDVGGPKLRLIGRTETLGSGGAAKYAALSYCWGKTMPESGMTKRLTLAAHQQAMDIQQLPKTVKDAIEIARGIGIPFLWIDALCIVQDSREDWEQEAASMGLVYSNAVVTIAAAVTDHCDGGCLRNLPQEVRPNPVLPEANAKFADYANAYLKYQRDKTLHDSSGWSKSFLGNVLLSRGWILQERELSRRIIYFAPSQVLWECRQARCSEDCPDGDPNEPSGFEMVRRCLDLYSRSRANFTKISNDMSRSQAGVAIETVNLEQRLLDWRETVSDYSGRSFTKIEDRLPALSGLASEFQKLIKDQYLAGLWRVDLPEALLWILQSEYSNKHWPTITRVRIQGYFLPTWSWVSISGPVQWPRVALVRSTSQSMGHHIPSSPLRARILECKVFPSGLDPNGNLSSGFIRLRGRMKIMAMSENKSRTARANFSIPGLYVAYDCIVDEYVTSGIYLLSILLHKSSKDSGECEVAGLVLAHTIRKDEFERIGYVWGQNSDWWSDSTDRTVTIV